MRIARVMVVDDSAVIRRLISDTLSEHPQIEIVASAANGQLALDALETTVVDVIVLDIEMPVLDGVNTVRALRRSGRRIPVIMFSTLTERGARITFDALAAGATDYVTKPAHSNSIEESRNNVRINLIPRVLALTGVAPWAEPGNSAGVSRSAATQVAAAVVVPDEVEQPAQVHPALPVPATEPLLASPTQPASLRPSTPPALSEAAAPSSPAPRPGQSPRSTPATTRPAPPSSVLPSAVAPARPAERTFPPVALRPGVPSASAVADSGTRANQNAVPKRASAAGGARIKLLVIGTSTGGPEALNQVLPLLPASFPVPILIVQHMPPIFTQLLAERLDRVCKLTVRESAGGELLVPGSVYIAPGDLHMEIDVTGPNAYTKLGGGAPENFCRPAVDVLFRSAARAFGSGVLGVVLTGMGSDGRRGAGEIRAAGGQVIAQDQASSVVWGMPGAVAGDGLAEELLDVHVIADAILRRISPIASSHSVTSPVNATQPVAVRRSNT
ncbi:response regulator receiver domain-containing protein [Jatrophihabitans sp. GAS493]|uniref:protein-glutamate methylesterase/protein-glutamine glutaminase n=1 Tax=Jatrophihabitans sp. GAS493 TaxID=1907575 RepID=UPI000BB784CF|nr:chemotaxis response regulator protein-glutamate methylesterase [Jatrophihabitans sp. GAS493]SOD74519.1 response regulator receiver domain-containing protein [Jatrophihabitans sp. GAS493]